jgi:N-acetylglutamate synthase-like GNAT family acetyltransferase
MQDQLADADANQIAKLLNERNELTKPYTRQDILKDAANYQIRRSDCNVVVACVEVKKVQWYQTEIRHLTVTQSEERKGHAKALLADAEQLARARDARILQCTIRQGNAASRRLFEGRGFVQVCTFFNKRSSNNVEVFQKVLETAPS